MAESVVVTKPWTRVRRAPSDKSGAMVIVYANDTLTVLGSSDGWTKIRTPSKVEGWVASSDVTSGVGPSMTSSSSSQESDSPRGGAESRSGTESRGGAESRSSARGVQLDAGI